MDIDKKIAEWEEVVTSESVIELSLALNECIDQLKECRGKEVLTGKVRNAAWNGYPLDGSDAQALEGALSQVESELKECREERDALIDVCRTIKNGLENVHLNMLQDELKKYDKDLPGFKDIMGLYVATR